MKKYFALFLVLIVTLFTLSGCASHNDNAPANSPPEPSANVTEPVGSDVRNDEAQAQSDEDAAIMEAPGRPNVKAEGPEEIEEIIAMEADFTAGRNITVFAIDPESGVQRNISVFSLSEWMVPSTSVYYYSSARHWLTTDFDKVAATLVIPDNNERRAGWVAEDGEFFDVTETLGQSAQSDFDTPARHEALGFTNDYFVYTVRNDDGEVTYYSVPIYNVVPEAVQEMNALENVVPDRNEVFNNDYVLSDWVDETHCLADHKHNGLTDCKDESLLFDVTTRETASYVPGDARYSWNGVVSPDGTHVAFLSVPKQGTESPNLYVTPLAGGDPVKVEIALSFSKAAGRIGYTQNPNLGDICVTLLDWR